MACGGGGIDIRGRKVALEKRTSMRQQSGAMMATSVSEIRSFSYGASREGSAGGNSEVICRGANGGGLFTFANMGIALTFDDDIDRDVMME